MSETLCPDHEALAVLAEHELSTPERARLIRHVTECRDCYVVYVETVRLLETAATSGQLAGGRPWVHVSRGTEPGRLARAWPGRWLLPGAAAALLAISIGIGWPMASRRLAAPAAPQRFPALARPDEGVPRREVRRQEAATQPDTAAWIRGAPWNSASQTRSSFAAAPSTRRAFLLGMHFASLDRACREPAPAVRQKAVAEIDRSLRAAGLMATRERQRLVARANSPDCFFDSPVGEAVTPWLSLGRTLEGWRIAAVERDASAFDPERQRSLGQLLAVIDLEKPAQLLGVRLAQQARLRDGESWDSLIDRLVELIELLCA